MNISDNGKKIIKFFEGLILHPYLDSAKVPTIGYGNTYYLDGTKVTMKDKAITKLQADQLFDKTIATFVNNINRVVTSKINQNQFDSLVSLSYNIGTSGFNKSTVLKRVNTNPSDSTIKDAFLMWSRAGTNSKALLSRRIQEAKLYFSS